MTRTPVALDDIAKSIIEQLQADGRRSYAEIGKAVGLSEAAVRQRVQKLIDAGLMQIVAVTDPKQLGFARQALIGIRATGDTVELAERIAEMTEVAYVILTAGSFDILAECVVADDDALITVLNHRIRALEGVVGTETFVNLRTVKERFDWGTR